MAYNYIDTPRTDAGDHHLSAANISFSEIHGFPSPSKDPANNLIGQLRNRNEGALKTPRARNALASLRAGARKNEFTPLLKSAANNRFRTSMRSPRRYERDGKENGRDEVVNSMLASTNEAPQTPAYLKPGYKDTGRTPRLPVDSSVIDMSRSSERTPGPPPAISSSTIMSTPLPELPRRGEQGRGEQGNVLTLREQEAKLAKLDKENFNLKLKIHFLDEALKRTGTDYQQGMIKENTELKMDKTTMAYELKQQQKALLRAEKEVEEYKTQLREYADKVKRRHTDDIMKEEIERLRKAAEDNKQLADEREEEVDELRKRLDLAEAGSDDKMQDLKDDIADLEQEIRAKEQEIDAKDEEIESLQDRLKSGDDSDGLQQEMADLEAELEQKDATIEELRSQLRSTQDREKSTKKLRGDVDMMEAEIRNKNALLDEKHEEIRTLQKRLQKAEAEGGAASQAKSAELRDKERLLENKDGEIKALEERLKTARGSWDAEAQQTDARLQEKDVIIQERDSQVRERARLIDEKNAEVRELRSRLESKDREVAEAAAQQEKQSVQRTTQIYELQEKLRKANSDMDFHIDKKNAEIQRLRKELDAAEQGMARLQDRLDSQGSPTKKDAVLNEQSSRIRRLENQLKTVIDEKDAELEELERQLTMAETEVEALKTKQKTMSPSRGAAGQVTALQQALEHALEEKEALDDEIVVLETNLEEAQNEQDALRKTVADLQRDLMASQSRLNGSPDKERNELRLRIKLVERQAEDYKQQVDVLEKELEKSWKTRPATATPLRERGGIRDKLAESEAKVARLETRLAELDGNIRHPAELTLPIERRDLHNMLKDAQIEIENLQARVTEQDKQVASFMKKEGETRARLSELRIERDDGIAELAERDGRISTLMSKERELRTQLQELRNAKFQLDDMELQLGAKKGSSSSHARREAELRSELREAQSDIDELNRQVQQRDDRLQAALRKEQQLRDRLKNSGDVEAELQALETRLRDREKKLNASATRETELKGRVKTLRAEVRALEPDSKALEVQEKTHEKELRGLSKQIQYLSARCNREASFRRDLVFVKRWFLLQVEMYGACNKADLKMIEEMGITPDLTVREKRPSLKAAGLAVVATIRMRKMKEAWAGSRKLHESLLKKLEAMKGK